MTNKTKDDDFNADFWLHVLTDAAARYIQDGGAVDIRETASGIIITLLGISMDNEVLSSKFTEVHQ